MILDFFASLSFYIIPYLTGRLFVKRTVQAWILGALLWFLAYFFVFEISLVLKFDFPKVIRSLVVIVSLISLVNLGAQLVKQKPKIRWSNVLTGLFLLGFTATVYFLIWKRNTPYPLQLNWDIYEHITLANLISSGKLSFLTSQISDTFTFNSYSPIFEILLSIPKVLFQRGLLGIYWWLEYWQYLLTAVASFVLAKKVFGNNRIAFLSAILSSLFFESVAIYSTLFLIPQTLVALVTIFVVAQIKELKWPMLVTAAVLILLMHYVIGALCLFVLAVLYLISHFHLPKKIFNLSIIASALLAAVLIFSNLFIHWSVPGIEEASHFNFQLIQKLGFITDWYGVFLFVFGLLGSLIIVKKESLSQKILLSLGLIILGISLAPFSYFLKFYVLGHYFWALIIAAGIWFLIGNLSSKLKFISIVFLTLILLVTFYKNQLVYKEPLNFKGYETQISYSEIQVGDWLSTQNKNDKAIIVSDPATQYILEANSGVNSQGGAYMDLKTRKILESINGYYDLNFMKNTLLSVKDAVDTRQAFRKTYFVVGGRYFAWQRLPNSQKESTFYNIWSPREITETDQIYIDYYKRIGLKEVYSNKELIIFEL